MLKKIFFQLHWFLGISAGLILSIMGITGAIYSYDQQILRAINADSYVVTAQNQEKLTPAQLYQYFQNKQPELKINSITVPKDPTASSTVNVAKEGERRGKNMMVNPYTAEVLPEIKGQEFFQLIQRIHRYLVMTEDIEIFGFVIESPGKKITGACALILIFFVLSGLYLRWPKKNSFRQWFAIKPKLKGRNFIWDLHAVVGTWVIVFYLIFAMTGLYWSYDWWRNGMFAVLGVERPQPQQQANTPTPRGEGQNRLSVKEQRAEEKPKSLTAEQMHYALSATWAGFNQQLTRDYSTLTINLPKDQKGEIKLSFVDVNPQHERARNNATYNYKDHQITEIELYEDKKLNEKIMSSMLPVHRGSFMGPFYQFFALLASLAMPLFFVTGWMLYLKRRKQKRLTQGAKLGSTSSALDPNAEKWSIFYASQTGTAEQIAYNTATGLQQAGFATEVKPLKDLDFENLQSLERALFIVSTYGTGDAPDLATSFAKKQMTKTGDLAQLRFAVLALGSKEYPETYCTFGHQVQNWLKVNQASLVFDLIEVDNGNKEDLNQWFNQLSQLTNTQIQAVITEKVYDNWTLSQRQLLNPDSLGEPAYSIQLTPETTALWHAGDIAEIQPGNSDERISQFIVKHELTSTPELRTHLRFKDLTRDIKIVGTSERWLNDLNALPSREYSIASIPEQGILELVVRQQTTNGELGLGSGWLTTHAQINEPLPLRIRNNPTFHLIDDNRPIILIGNGTGIAGLLSLIKQRALLGFHQNWLVFGERQHAVDYFYQSEIEDWQAHGVLQHVDLAFSRDQEQRIYVQDKIIEQQHRLKKWVDEGAVIYVCGSIDGMASSVDHALIDILGEAQVQKLHEESRYRRDVY